MIKKFGLGLILILSAIFLFHNITAYPYDNGMDYLRRVTYARIVSHEFRLPTYAETTEVYDAPLFYFVSGWLARAIEAMTGFQFLDALGLIRFGLAALTIISFWLWSKIFAGFYPKNKFGAVGFILLLASMPVFYKAGVMYVSELLTLFLTTLTLYFFINYWIKKPDFKHTFWLAVLISIGLLTRISFLSVWLAILAGIIFWFWLNNKPAAALKPTLIIIIVTVLTVSWFYVARFQNTIFNVGYDQAALKIDQPRLDFYFRIPVKVMLTYPFRPVLSEPSYLWPIYYADFWGDYWNYFPQTRFGQNELQAARSNRQLFSEARRKYLSWQSWINLVPSLLISVAFLWLLVCRLHSIGSKKITQKILAELISSALVIFTWLSLIVLLTKYPGQGDLIKSTYTLYIVPIYAYATVVFLFDYLAKFKVIFWPTLAILAVAVINNFIFSWF